MDVLGSGVATPGHTRGHLPRHHLTLPRHQNMWFTLALAKILHFMTQNAPHTTETHQILPILMLLIHLRVQHSQRDFPLKRLLLQQWCMCVTIIRIFPQITEQIAPLFHKS